MPVSRSDVSMIEVKYYYSIDMWIKKTYKNENTAIGLTLLFEVNIFGQKVSIDLTFSAIKNTAYFQLDSVKVTNRTQVGEAVIHWPDTTLTSQITPGELLLYIGYSTGYPVGVMDIQLLRIWSRQELRLQDFRSQCPLHQGLLTKPACLPEDGVSESASQ